MGERAEFLNQCDVQSLDRAINAARADHLVKGPMESGLDRVHTVTRGLGEIFRILQANAIKAEDCHAETAADSCVEPPFGSYTTDALLGLGAAVSQMLSSDIERLAELADKCGAPTEARPSRERG